MKKIIYTLLATMSVVMVLFSYRTSTQAVLPSAGAAPTSAGAPSSGGVSQSTTGAGSPPDTPQQPSQATPSAHTLSDGTVQGQQAQTPYGPMQVQITVSGGVITDVQAIKYPTGSLRDQLINSQAIPLLVNETLRAQSADIAMVSGATYTSDGYLRSLQSAIDAAKS